MNEIQLLNLKRVYMRDYLYHSNCLACRALSYKWWIRFYVFFINKFVVIYFIDILIYSRSETAKYKTSKESARGFVRK
jgi:hypothetical protein